MVENPRHYRWGQKRLAHAQRSDVPPQEGQPAPPQGEP